MGVTTGMEGTMTMGRPQGDGDHGGDHSNGGDGDHAKNLG